MTLEKELIMKIIEELEGSMSLSIVAMIISLITLVAFGFYIVFKESR